MDAALTVLLNLDHRGAVGAEENTGDGAGLLTQVPDAFLRAVVDFPLPPAGGYAPGLVFLPGAEDGPAAVADAVAGIETIAAEEDLTVLGWREVPTDPSMIGPSARESMPTFRRLFVADAAGKRTGLDLDRRTFRLRKRIEREPGRLPRLAVRPDPGLQGHAHHHPPTALLPRPLRRAAGQRDRPGALPLLHQHLPVLAARPAVPAARAQRGDQHRARQPRLDGGPGGHRVLGRARRPGAAHPDLHPRRLGLGHLRRGPRGSSTSPAGPCRTRS